jgi:molybdenum cofactor biosynthesis protein B
MESLDCVVLSVSDVRTLESDTTGKSLCDRLNEAGHRVVEHTVVPRDPARLAPVVRHWLQSDVAAILVNGGTGVGFEEDSMDVIRRFLDLELPGFAQVFVTLAYEEVGAPAWRARVLAGIARGKAVFVLPGARWAVQLGMEHLIVPELGSLVSDLRQEGPSHPSQPSQPERE